jgi:hypothetical protein
MKIYYCHSGRADETEVIREIRPENLLLSYFYFKNKPLQGVIEKLGYKPNILLDSGAYTAFTTGKNIALPDYIKYIQENINHIENYISLDVIGDSYLSYQYFIIMREKGLKPIPVFHYNEDYIYLARYYRDSDCIALGGCVGKDKTKVIQWVKTVTGLYSDMRFHLLGSSSPEIINNTTLFSCDSSTWIKKAFNGNVKISSLLTRKESKKKL